MDRIDCLHAFTHVYALGSFSGAATQLGISQPTVSKRIAALETEFQAQLFLRTTRALVPTEEGKRLYDVARSLLETYEDARADAQNKARLPRGRLTISLPAGVGRGVLLPIFASFMRDYPQLEFDMRLSDRTSHLLEEGAECAVRVGELSDSTLRARPLCRLPRIAVAAPEYLRMRPKPRVPSDLTEHITLAYAGFGERSEWAFEGEDGRHVVPILPKMRMDDIQAVADMTLMGLGVSVLPGWLAMPALRAGQLERILPDHTVPSVPVSFLTPPGADPSLRVRCLLDYLLERRGLIADRMAGDTRE